MLGSYTGSVIADYLFAMLRDFSVTDIDYFITDNATNNNKALEVLIGM